MKYRLAVDTGGTFTDLCLLCEDTGEIRTCKVSSTPDDPSRAVLAGLKKITGGDAGVGEITFLIHGTTVATNALLEGRKAVTAMLTTLGFRDILLIGRQNRPHLYNFRQTKPPPLIPRHLTFEVEERVGHDGQIIRPLNRDRLQEIIRRLKEKHVQSVAVCLLHSYANPVHEREIGETIITCLPGVEVTLSSELLPEFREYERASTTAVNAAVSPLISRYIRHLEDRLKHEGVKCSLFIMHSGGGVITASQACRQSARTVLSGPAGGVLAGLHIAHQTGRPNLITADMGGTSMDVCLIYGGQPRYTPEGSVGGYPIRLPMLDIHTIGAGGGSIAWLDRGGALRVGPQSAGADPGPACYGRGGTEPTVTDANLVLGRLKPGAILGGDRKLDLELARRAIAEKIARPLGMTVEEAAEGIIRVVNASMVRAMRMVSVQQGFDPRDFTVVAFGGAGPLHAAELAAELGAPTVLIPLHPGVGSAWGMLSADVVRDYVQVYLTGLEQADIGQVNEILHHLERKGRTELEEEGFDREKIEIEKLADLRYAGQSHELTLSLPRGSLCAGDLYALTQIFHRAHRREYGFSRPDAPIELVALRLKAKGKLPPVHEPALPPGEKHPQPTGYRTVYFNGRTLETAIYWRACFGPGSTVTGPALIEQEDTVTLLRPGDTARCDRWGNLIIDLEVK